MPADAEARQYRVADTPAAVDQIRGAPHPESQGPVDAIHLDDLFVLVGQQGERQIVFRPELGMGFRALRADPDHAQAGVLDFALQVAQGTGLAGAAGGENGGGKKQGGGSGGSKNPKRRLLFPGTPGPGISPPRPPFSTPTP